MKIVILRSLFLALLSLTLISWGFYGHRKINRYAVFSLPPEMIGFYKRHIEYLTQHAVDPDKRRYVSENEAVKHYIDLDHFGYGRSEVFDSIPANWKMAKVKFTEDTLKTFGILPWNIYWVHQQLTRSFEERNTERILQLSAELGHYLADAHVPLHTTENYNGQLSGQKGIHGLWESRIPEIQAEHYDLMVGKAEYYPQIIDVSWQIIKESHLLVDSVLSLEKNITAQMGEHQKYSIEQRGGSLNQNYSKEFALTYEMSMRGMVEKRLRLSIKRVASFWFTAWVNAGQPKLNKLVLGEDDPATKKLDSAYQLSKIKGRAHQE